MFIARAALLAGLALAQHSTLNDSVNQRVAASADELVLKDKRTLNEAGAEEGALEAENAEGENNHADEKEGEGHTHEDEQPSEAMKTTSYLLIGFLVVNFVMVALVNYNDANVRSYTWKMMSACVSIYLAVVVDGSVSSLCMEFVKKLATVADADEEGKEGEDPGTHIASALLQFLIFIACFAGVNFLCFKTRRMPQFLYATSVIGGHLTAFALIKAWLQLHAARCIWWATPIFVFAGLAGMRVGSRHVRIRWLGQRESVAEEEKQETEQEFLMESVASEQAANKWPAFATDAEDEASAIAQSFVIGEIVIAAYFNGDTKEAFSPHTKDEIIMMFGAELVCLVLIVSMTFIRKLANKKAEEIARGMFDRVLENLETTVAMTMSWLALDLFFWISCWFFHDVEMNFIAIISAGILTACSILGIILLDMFADKIVEEESEVADSTKNTYSTYNLPEGALQQQARKAQAILNTLDLSNLERGIRSVITSIALSVGLAWEHAFHEATHTIIETNPSLHVNKTLSKTFIAGLSVALMAPVWLKYIVKKAMKPVKAHQAMMNMDNNQAGER